MLQPQLSPNEKEKLRDAFLSAFRRQEDLEQFLLYKFGEHLNHITAGGSQRQQVTDVIEWAESRGLLIQLIERAHAANPGNELLSKVYDDTFSRQQDDSADYFDSTLTDRNIEPTLPPVEARDLEALIFGWQSDTRLPYSFIQDALLAGRSIAHLTVPRWLNGKRAAGVAFGTGWLIAPGVVITNYHVIAARDTRREQPPSIQDFEAQAQSVIFRFDYYTDAGTYIESENARLIASNSKLDYALLELADPQKIADRVALRLADDQVGLIRGSRLNIAQHPGGGPLRYAIRNNFYVSASSAPGAIRYQTDTERGASGSPVCTDQWEVVALHRASSQVPENQPPQEVIAGNPVTVTVLNEAVMMSAILDSLAPEVRARITQ